MERRQLIFCRHGARSSFVIQDTPIERKVMLSDIWDKIEIDRRWIAISYANYILQLVISELSIKVFSGWTRNVARRDRKRSIEISYTTYIFYNYIFLLIYISGLVTLATRWGLIGKKHESMEKLFYRLWSGNLAPQFNLDK